MKFSDRLEVATRHILNADLKSAVKSVAGYGMELNPSTFRNGADWFNVLGNGGMHHFRWTGFRSSLTAYQKCAPVAAIINRQAQCYINGKTWVLSTSGKRKGKEAETFEANKLKKLFLQPNPLRMRI